jgi:probable rRNA maturation factor
VPPRSWRLVTSALERMAAQLFPDGSVGLEIVSDRRIHALNLRYRGVDDATDILSFPDGDDTLSHRGDLALSWDAVRRQAVANGNSDEQEAVALLAHGLLHLAGYDHDTDVTDAEMNRRTRELCRLAQIEVDTFGH